MSLRDNVQIPLSPSYRLDAEILKKLCEKNLLLFNTQDAHHYVEADENGEIKIDFFQMNFDFAYNDDQLYQIVIDSRSKEFKDRLIASPDYKEQCKRIQLEECIKYLNKRSILNDLSPSIGEKMESLLSICLSNYSVSEVYYIIWGAVESASSYRNKPNITRVHASNSIYKIIQSRFDSLTTHTLQSKRYNRDSKHPKSAIEKVFFDRVYGIEDCGFKCTVNELLMPFETRKLLNHSSYSNLMSQQIEYASIKISVPKK